MRYLKEEHGPLKKLGKNMKITTQNKHIINSGINIHNSRFLGYAYWESEQSLLIECENRFLNKGYCIKFNHILYSEWTCSNPDQHKSEVLFWELVRDKAPFDKIASIDPITSQARHDEFLYISSKITLLPWKQLFVVCKDIDFEEYPL